MIVKKSLQMMFLGLRRGLIDFGGLMQVIPVIIERGLMNLVGV